MCRFLDGMGLSRFWFYLTCFGRVQGLLPLAPAPFARLGHTLLDQVVRFCNTSRLRFCNVLRTRDCVPVHFYLWDGAYQYRALAGATASGACTLCQAGAYQTGSGRPLLQYIVTRDVSRSGRRASESIYASFACAGAVTAGACSLCQPGSYQTGAGRP
jgi:hypothetical protein